MSDHEFSVNIVKRVDGTGWTEHWYYPYPNPWDDYVVLGDSWNEDRTVRSIFEIGAAGTDRQAPQPEGR